MEFVTGYVILGSSVFGVLLAFFALAYAASKNLNVDKIVHILQKESEILDIKVKKPDLVQINRAVKFSYNILKSPTQRKRNRDHLDDMIKYMLEIRDKLTDADWVHIRNKNLNYLLELREDSEENLRDYVEKD